MHDLFGGILIGVHLLWRGPFLRHKHAADERAIAYGQKRLGYAVE